MRLTLVIASLSAGGAERVMSTLANAWAAREREVTVVTLASAGKDFFPLDSRVRRVALDECGPSSSFTTAIARNVRRITRLRAALQKSRPAVVVSFGDMTNVTTVFAAAGLGIPVLISERTDFRVHEIGPIWSALRHFAYGRASALVVPSRGLREAAIRTFRTRRVLTVPNPARTPSGNGRHAETLAARHRLVSMGRLGPEKQFDVLIRAFAECARRHPEWSLSIVGDGPLHDSLLALAGELGVADRVSLAGAVRDTDAALYEAGLFALTSRYEGFPNALLEAMACGLPVVCFDCSDAIREIVRPDVDGIVVAAGDTNSLAKALDRLMCDDETRLRMGRAAQSVTQRFGIESVLEMWNTVFHEYARCTE